MNNSLSSEGVVFSNVASAPSKEKLNAAAQCEFEYIEDNFFSEEICKCMQGTRPAVAGASGGPGPAAATDGRCMRGWLTRAPRRSVGPRPDAPVLWGDKAVKDMAEKCYFRAPWDFKFFQDIPRIFGPEYSPEDDDVVGLRMPTSGTAEYGIQTDSGLAITVVDIGGKRNDRNMWYSELDSSDAIIFFISLTDYASSQSMIGDAFSYLGNDAAVKHRYLENLSIFGKVRTSPTPSLPLCLPPSLPDSLPDALPDDALQVFASAKMDKIPVFVVFTKPDLFEEMIKAKEPAMSEEYPEYDGPESDADCAEDFLRHKMHRVAQVANFGKALDLPSFVVNLQDNDQFVEIFERVCELLNEHSLEKEREEQEQARLEAEALAKADAGGER